MSDASDDEFPFPVTPCSYPEMGDGFAAARNLQAGELVLRVAPVAAVPKDAFIRTVCGRCFQNAKSTGAQALILCSSCEAVSFCNTCRGLEHVLLHHKQECDALGVVRRMQAQASKGAKRRTSTKRTATANSSCSTEEDSSTLRLVLSIACWVARSRQAKQRSRVQAGSDESNTGSDAAGSTARYGPDDVIEDSVQDLEQLVGEPEEDLSPELQARFLAACSALKAAQPAWARASLASYMRWATKVHLNEHDICIRVDADADHGRGAGDSDAGRELAAGGAGQPGEGQAAAASCEQGASKRQRRGQAGKRRQGEPQEMQNQHSPGQGEQAAAEQGAQASSVQAVGEGLFPTIARLNHSCVPNCRLSYDQWGCLVVRAAGPVAKGKQLFASYVPAHMPLVQRRQHLHDRYGFWCKCEACVRELAAS